MKLQYNTISIIGALIAIAAVAIFFLLGQQTPSVQAAGGDNVFGNAWGASGPNQSDASGISWIRMNNCDSPDPNDCSGTDFGVNIDSDGDFSGQAWSVHYGWVDFDLSHPDQVCTNLGTTANVDLAEVAANGSAPVTGFAHVYSAGDGDGTWDGCIKMSGSWSDGVTVYDNGDFTGLAWGDGLIGWVNFDAVTVATGCTDPDADNYESVALFDDGSCTYTGDYCQNMDVLNDGNLIDSEADFDLMNDQLPSGSQYTQYTIGGFDVCLIDPDDECQNENEFPGVQSSVPADHFQTYIGGVLSCVPVVDVCQTDPNDCPTLPGNFTPPVFQEI